MRNTSAPRNNIDETFEKVKVVEPLKLGNNTNIPSELNNVNETLMEDSNHHPGISSSPARTRKIPKPVKKRLQSAIPYNKP